MASSSSDDPRVTKLSAFFNKVLYGQRTLSTARDGKLFIEAMCVQADPATCAHKLLSSPSGLSALQASVRFDTSVTFLNEDAVSLLRYLQTPSLKAIGSGSVLAQLLLSMVEPPFFWKALTKSFTGGLLNSNASQAFAWLLLQLISLPGKASSPYLAVANSSNILDTILKSPDGETRILGQKIKHALPLDASELCNDAEVKPGGRHDNDNADHREISIMPTADELLSKDRPFYRTAQYIDDPKIVSSRYGMHLDNQFRLLREDMLGEIREELKILTGTKAGHHKGIIVDGGTPTSEKIQPHKRKNFLEDNRHILRQGNMACLLVDGEPAAFPTIHRDEEELVKTPATITVQLADGPALSYALSKMKTAGDVKLVQLDAAIFAYEPFLRRLQDMNDLPLRDELFYWETGKDIAGPSFQPAEVIRALESRSGTNLKDFLRLTKSVVLDESQTNSLCACLLRRVSLVQGPPGES
ncbi:hypothetical protein LTR66_000591 [Elasticomyces elasticus]|nr:hypothetical protein LTR66_000591 [Elasticomyces elasticus]